MSGRRLIAIIVGVVGILLLAVVAFFLIRQNNEPDPVPPAPEEVVVDGELIEQGRLEIKGEFKKRILRRPRQSIRILPM